MSAFAVRPSACVPPSTTLHMYTSITQNVSIQYCVCKLSDQMCTCASDGCNRGGCLK